MCKCLVPQEKQVLQELQAGRSSDESITEETGLESWVDWIRRMTRQAEEIMQAAGGAVDASGSGQENYLGRRTRDGHDSFWNGSPLENESKDAQ